MRSSERKLSKKKVITCVESYGEEEVDDDGDEAAVNKRLIKVSFLPQKVVVKYNNECKVEVELYSKIDVDGCTWTLDKKTLVITCEKPRDGEIWPRLELSG